jgi:hypothetical protein
MDNNNSINSDIEMTVEMDVSMDNNNINNDSKFKIYILNYDINWIFNRLCCLNQFPEFQRNMQCVNNVEYIKWTFHRLDIGKVLSCKIIDNDNNNYCIEVIFDNLYDTRTGINFYNNLINNYETRIVHDEPKFWIIYI